MEKEEIDKIYNYLNNDKTSDTSKSAKLLTTFIAPKTSSACRLCVLSYKTDKVIGRLILESIVYSVLGELFSIDEALQEIDKIRDDIRECLIRNDKILSKSD